MDAVPRSAPGEDAQFEISSPGVLRILGELDFGNADTLADALAGVVPSDGKLTVDATGAAFIGVSAVRALVDAARTLRGTARLTVRNPPALLRRVLDVCHWADEIDLAYEQRFEIRWDSPETEDVTLDEASARDLRLFLSRLPPQAHGEVTRPVLVWHDGRRSVVDLHVVRADDGSWKLRVGGERSEDAAPDTAEVIDPRLDELSAMVWVTDGDRLARWFNTAWLEFVGAHLDDELGWGWMRHVHEPDVFGLLQVYEAAQQAGRGFEHTARVVRADGELWWLRVRALPRFDDGVFGGFIGICEPIGSAPDLVLPGGSGLADLLPAPDLALEPPVSVVERLARLERVLAISRPADVLEARLLRQLASRWINQHEELRPRHDDIVLAVGEAAANATEHAYGASRGFIRLACELQQSTAQFRIRDWGTWRAPSSDRDHRGIELMSSLADDLHINHLTDGTEVVLKFEVPGE